MTATTATGFTDPTAQRLERDQHRRRARRSSARCSPRPCTTRAGWRCDVALISGGKSNLTYRVASDAGEVVLRRPPLGHVLPTAHDMVREHRVLRALEGTAVPVPRVLHLGDADGPLGAPFYVMERVLGHVCRNALPPGYADAPEQRGGDRRGARRRARRPAHRRPGRRGAGGLRPAGRLHGAPAAPLVAAVGGLEGAASCRRSTRCATTLARHAARRSGPAAIVHGDYRLDNTILHPTAPGPHRRRARLGDEHARRPVRRPRRAARLLERGRRRPTVLAAARIVAPVTAAEGFPTRARDRPSATPRAPASTSRTSTGTGRSPTSSSRSSARASPRAPPAARCSAPGFDDAQRLVAPLVDAGRYLLGARPAA